jgi:hypothetical protein
MTLPHAALAEAAPPAGASHAPRADRARRDAPDAASALTFAPSRPEASLPPALIDWRRAGERALQGWQALAQRQVALAGEALGACAAGWCRVLAEPSPERRLELRAGLVMDSARWTTEAGVELAGLAMEPARGLAEAGAAAWLSGLDLLAGQARG